MISFERKSGAKDILIEDNSHKDLMALNLILGQDISGLWLSALSHTHTYSYFPIENAYMKSFAITD